MMFRGALAILILATAGAAAAQPATPAPSDQQRIQGTWKVVALVFEGKRLPIDQADFEILVIFNNDTIQVDCKSDLLEDAFPKDLLREVETKIHFRLDTAREPKRIEATMVVKVEEKKTTTELTTLYRLDQDRLTFAVPKELAGHALSEEEEEWAGNERKPPKPPERPTKYTAPDNFANFVELRREK